MKKKLLSVLLAGCMVLSLAGCGSGSGDSGSTTQDSGQTPTTDTNAAQNSSGGVQRMLVMLPQTRRMEK